MNKTLLALSVAALTATSGYSQITGVNLYDDTISFFNGSTKINTGVYEVRWGTYSNNVFTPYFGAAAGTSNDGYIGDPFGTFEISVSLTAADNTVAPVGSQLYMAITFLADNASYVSGQNEIILTDTSWIVPTLSLAGDPVDYVFTPVTTAVKGTYSFGGGTQVLTLGSSAIPEPSSFAALAGLAVLGAVASRRRRSV